jgi:poly(hydroxyalkanoate) depolymerase family esterase
MVMVLHGCEQTHDDVLNEWGWKAAADRYGFILVAPFITSYDGLRNTNCWGFWFDQHNHEGMGEPEDLHQIGIEVESNYTIDPNRRYITGLSSGGGMTMVVAVTHNEYWAAAAPAAGLPYGEDAASVSFSGCPGNAFFHGVGMVVSDMQRELDDNYKIPLLVLSNEKDCTVLITAGQNLRDTHLRVFGEASHDTASTAKASEAACTPFFQNNYGCKHVRYTQDGTTSSRSLVETVFYSGPQNTADPTDKDRGHYWIGGQQGMEGNYAVRAGPSYPDIAWDFFSRHARGVSAPIGVPQITLNGPNPLEINLNTTFADPGATATDREDGPLAVTADCSRVDTAAVGEYTCIYTATDSDNHTAAVSRTVLVKDPNAPTATCNSVLHRQGRTSMPAVLSWVARSVYVPCRKPIGPISAPPLTPGRPLSCTKVNPATGIRKDRPYVTLPPWAHSFIAALTPSPIIGAQAALPRIYSSIMRRIAGRSSAGYR